MGVPELKDSLLEALCLTNRLLKLFLEKRDARYSGA